jgi:hypothetical protein
VGGPRPSRLGVDVASVGTRAGTTPRTTPATTRARLPDAPWLAQAGDGRWIFGRGDRPPIRRLPAGEVGLAIDRSSLATVIPTRDGRSLLRIRDAASGRQLRDVAAPIWIATGAFTPAGLVVAGYRDVTMAADGGLLLVAPDTGAISTLVEGGPYPPALGALVARGDVLVSPSGRSVASNACGPERCLTQVVDLETREVSRPVDGDLGFLRAVTDEAVVTTDDAGRWIRARAIADGRETWRRDGASLIEPAAMADGSVVGLVGSARDGWAIGTIDARGRLRDLTPRGRAENRPPALWRPVMTPSTVVFGATSFGEALGSRRTADVTVVDAATGRWSSASVRLPAATETLP